MSVGTNHWSVGRSLNPAFLVDGFIYVESPSDFPAAVAGVITLEAKEYKVLGTVDMTGDRFQTVAGTVITGSSSESSVLKSTGLTGPLFTASESFPVRFITLTAAHVLDLDGSTGTNPAFDWLAVNMTDCAKMGTIKDYDNVIFSDCALLGSDELTFDGTIGTIAFGTSLLLGSGAAKSMLILPSTLTVSRRFRVSDSAIVSTGSNTAIEVVDESATFSNESFILDTVNFSGGGTYLDGTSSEDNEALIRQCNGVSNSSDVAEYYMTGNATATTVSVQGTYYKIAGVTLAGSIVEKFTLTNNRATYVGALTTDFKVDGIAAVTSGNNRVISIAVAKNGSIVAASAASSTTNSGGRSEGIHSQTIVQLTSGDYVEIWGANTTNTDDFTGENLSAIITAL